MPAERTWWGIPLVAVLFLLGLASKPTLWTLPCLFLLLGFWPLNRTAGSGSDVAEAARVETGTALPTRPSSRPRTMTQLVLEKKAPPVALVAGFAFLAIETPQNDGLTESAHPQVDLLRRKAPLGR